MSHLCEDGATRSDYTELRVAVESFESFDNDLIKYLGPDHELKIKIASALNPELFKLPDYIDYLAGGRSLSADVLSQRGYKPQGVLPTLERAAKIFADIQDKYNQVPVEELSAESVWNSDLSILSTIVSNELRSEAPEISDEMRENIVSKHHHKSHQIKFAAEIALENSGWDESGSP